MKIIISGLLGHMGREVLNLAENGVREEAENDSSRGDGLLSLQREINEFLSENK